MPRLLSHFLIVATCAVLLVLTGCATSSQTVDVDVPADLAELSVDEREQLLRSESERWNGTPHVLGGTTTRGVDCSGLVHTLFLARFDISMPRTTRDQVKAGDQISRAQLEAGDLVFFRPTPKSRHVGIYISDGEFMHAASSTGVSVDHLDDSYWRPRYWTARRILPEAKAQPSSEVVAVERTDSSQGNTDVRSGW